MKKAEIERAIERIAKDADDAFESAGDPRLTKEETDELLQKDEDYETALDALSEALKRVEGCPACRGKKLLFGHPGAFPVKVDASPYGSTLDVEVPDYGGNIGFSVEINFCPYCGRRLGEEAQDDQTGSH